MNATLEQVWDEVKKYLEDGFSIIPVRDKPEFKNGIWKKPKSPYNLWAEYQARIITPQDLMRQMIEFDTTAIGVICGKISGNLEAIDIDVKYKAGIDGMLIKDLLEIYPELYKKIRIHRTPTTGCHFLYRVKDFNPPGNRDLAARYATDEEQEEHRLKNPKAGKIKSLPFIQTRGEGGYVLAPPSLGYTILNNVPIQEITKHERDTLWQLCQNYNLVFKEADIYKPEKKELDYYDVSPFIDFSQRADPKETLEDLGWILLRKRPGFIWFTKPSGTSGNVHGSFDIEKKVFRSFTNEAGLDPERRYFLSSMVIDLKFEGNKTQARKFFVDKGYGKINETIEKRISKRNAITGKPPPPNLSEEAKQGYEELKKHLDELLPFGPFWEENDEGKLEISREKLYAICTRLGYRLYTDDLYYIKGKFLYDCTEREFYDNIKAYIKIEDAELYEDVCNTYEKFIEQHGKFTISRLPILGENEIIVDTKTTCCKFFNDKWIKITKEEIEENTYENLNRYIFAKKIQGRKMQLGEGGRYIDYLEKCIRLKANYEYIQNIVGYYAHDYNDETMGYMVICTEECEDPKEGGRSGKNMFANLFAQTITYTKKGGSQTKFDEKTFQTWKGERVFAVHDLPKDFDLSFFKDISTGGFVLKKLFKNEVTVDIRDSPKLLFSTNFSFNCSDGGLAARVIPLEFNDFFKRHGGVDTYYGGAYFPFDWNDEDWAGFDGFIVKSVQLWLKNNCKLKPKDLSKSGWNKQFEFIYGVNLTQFIEENWTRWLEKEFVSNKDFTESLNSFYIENSVPMNYRSNSPTKVNKALTDYAVHANVHFKKDHARSEGMVTVKGRIFTQLQQKQKKVEENNNFLIKPDMGEDIPF